MKTLNYTLLTDGTSDRVLLHIIDWLLNDLMPKVPVQGEYADLSYLKDPPSLKRLDRRIEIATELFPCDILFVHRDAEHFSIEKREAEIKEGWQKTSSKQSGKIIPVIPVRMTEAWLLIDSEAIKTAAGNRNFRGDLVLPKVSQLENEPDPKALLFNLIRYASGLKGRRLDKLSVHSARHILAERIQDFSPLRKLSSFQYFERIVRTTLKEMDVL